MGEAKLTKRHIYRRLQCQRSALLAIADKIRKSKRNSAANEKDLKVGMNLDDALGQVCSKSESNRVMALGLEEVASRSDLIGEITNPLID